MIDHRINLSKSFSLFDFANKQPHPSDVDDIDGHRPQQPYSYRMSTNFIFFTNKLSLYTINIVNNQTGTKS